MYQKLIDDPGLPVPNPTQSYWQVPAHPELQGIKSSTLPARRDIVIIGSGITACSVLHHLVNGGFTGTISLLEAREVCSGATGRNGGRINCVAVHDYDRYRRKFGDDAARKIVRFELAHFDQINAVALELGPDLYKASEVREVETVAAVFSDVQLRRLKQMLADFDHAFPELAGRWKVVEEEADQMYGIQGATGALIGKAGAAWPYRLVTNLFAKFLETNEHRFSIETSTPVLAIDRDASLAFPYILTTPRGLMQARHVIHCTEGHAANLIPKLRGILVPRRGQMTVQNPGTNFRGSNGKRSWSFYFHQGFDYLSQHPLSGELFVGGGELGGIDGGLEVYGIASDDQESIPAKSHLTGVLPVVFGSRNWGLERPGRSQLHASWTGILCSSLDGVPMVGRLPQEVLLGDRAAGNLQTGAEWISAGYGGYGMVNAWKCGEAVAHEFLGQDVSSWLPPEYSITPERMLTLSSRLAEIAGSEKHLRALL